MRSSRASSVSSLNSNTSAADPESTMQIFIKNVGNETFTVTIPQSSSVGNLRSLLALRTHIPESQLRLVHGGKHLSALTQPLSDFNITRESTVHLVLPVRGGAPKKVRCSYKDCKDRAQAIFGDCGFCTGHFCGKHRMLESHNCEGLENCKREEKERNREKLESERTVAIKGI